MRGASLILHLQLWDEQAVRVEFLQDLAELEMDAFMKYIKMLVV